MTIFDARPWFEFWADGPDPHHFELGQPIMYWSQGKRPEDYEDAAGYIEPERRRWVIETLKTSPTVEEWRGGAGCRLCRVYHNTSTLLGHRDLGAFGFVWPEGAEHYIIEHGVWHPDLDALYEAAHGGKKA